MRLSLLAAFLNCIYQVSAAPGILLSQLPDYSPSWVRSPSDIKQALGPQLSSSASIYFPGSTDFTDGASRWSTHANPNISIVVQVATANDVAATIKYANSVNMPFLAVNQGHGNVNTLEKLQGGIVIWLTQLDSIEVAADGKTAVLGGGVYIKQIIDELAQYNKVAASGACGCVGLMGAGLGGGHGRMQGLYGLIIDNFIDLNVVLWNGTQVTVSATSHPELFWAMRGAGHNFGIVTSATYKIYDEPSPTWYYGTYSFAQDKLEPVFEELIQQMNAQLPPEMGYVYVNYMWNSNVSTTEPAVVVTLNYAGDTAAAAPYANPFKALNPVTIDEGEVPYTQLSEASGTDVDDFVCVRGKEYFMHGADLLEYNVTASRAIYELYNATSSAYPDLQQSVVMFESYSQQGVKAVAPDSTAFPNRESNIVFALMAIYDTNPALDDLASEWSLQARNLAHAGQAPGSTLDVYVNYAYGDETVESVYGNEPWRIEKLRGLKKEWDPYNKFGWYMPIS